MWNWLAENWVVALSLFLSILSLFLHFIRLRHDIKKSSVMLAVKFKEVRSRGEIEKDVLGTEALEPWDKKGLYERFVVTITNTGNVEAFIGDVGVIDEHGRKASALVRRTANDTILTRITNVDGEVIAPKSAKSYIVYHGRDENFIEARKAFVVDQTGLEWKSNHRI